MAGAGVLPGRAAAEARRQGWRVVAFAFEEAPGLAAAADIVVPAAISDIQAVLMRLYGERPQAALFVGKFWKQRVFEEAGRADQAARRLAGGDRYGVGGGQRTHPPDPRRGPRPPLAWSVHE